MAISEATPVIPHRFVLGRPHEEAPLLNPAQPLSDTADRHLKPGAVVVLAPIRGPSLPARGTRGRLHLIPDMHVLTQRSLEREHLLSPAIAHDRCFRFANEGVAVDQCTDHRIQRGVLSGACRDSDA